MTDSAFYHAGQRGLQDRFESRRIADRLEMTARSAFTAEDKAFIESASFFFLATSDAEGQPDCSFKGGPPGFVRITGPSELAFPDYDGNGMFRSLGNISASGRVGMLFISMEGSPRRLRVNGVASIDLGDPLTQSTVGAQMTVRVNATFIFPNCPRYVPLMRVVEPSVYTPKPGCEPVEPAWKSFDSFKDSVHPRQPTFKG